MLSLIWFSQWSAYIIIYLNMLYKKKLLDKNNASPTVEWLFRVANLHIIGPGRSVMLPEVFGHVSLYLHRAQTPEKKQ